jgi:hypothetical protein
VQAARSSSRRESRRWNRKTRSWSTQVPKVCGVWHAQHSSHRCCCSSARHRVCMCLLLEVVNRAGLMQRLE